MMSENEFYNDSCEEELISVPVPALVAVLLNAENSRETPLTELEVLEIRDNAQCMMMPLDVAEKVIEERGYDDIDPEDVWSEWQRVRVDLIDNT